MSTQWKILMLFYVASLKFIFFLHRIGDLFSVDNLFHWLLDFFMNILPKDSEIKPFNTVFFIRKLLYSKVDKK